MYRCKRCNKPLTESDVAFNKSLSPGWKPDGGECFSCVTNEKALADIYAHEQFKKGRLFSLIFIIYTIAIICTLINIGMDNVDESVSLYFLGLIVFWITGAVLTIKGFKLDFDTVQVGSHYETTFSSDGTATTKEVGDYSDDDLGKAIGLGVSYPIWCLPYVIYKEIKYRSSVPKSLRDAYKAYQKNKLDVPQNLINDFKKSKKKYEDDSKEIYDTYSFLNDGTAERRIAKLKKPQDTVTINGTKYDIIDASSNACYLLLGCSKSGIGREEKILIKDSWLYGCSNIPREANTEWKKLNGIEEAPKAVGKKIKR